MVRQEITGAFPLTTKGRPIQPADIDINQHFFDAFDNNETEVSAHYIVGLCQQRGNWEPFTQREIEAYYRSFGHTDGFTFNRLIEPQTVRSFDGSSHTAGGGWIIQEGDQYVITPEFIRRVYQFSPAK